MWGQVIVILVERNAVDLAKAGSARAGDPRRVEIGRAQIIACDRRHDGVGLGVRTRDRVEAASLGPEMAPAGFTDVQLTRHGSIVYAVACTPARASLAS